MRIIISLFLLTTLIFASIGRVGAISGSATIQRDGKSIDVTLSSLIENNDMIKTTKGSRVQIVFKDRTIITIGSNSSFSVSDYLYDESSKQASASFNLSKGIFKAMTGKIGKIAPNRFKMKIKTATIGIRGTRFMGKIDDDVETIACTEGMINVKNDIGSVDVRAGEITFISAGAIPQPPRDITKEDLKEFNAKLEMDPALATKISNIKLGKDLTFNKEEVAKVVAEIKKIKDTDAKMAALNQLENNLINQLENAASKNMITYTKNAYEDGKLSWGFYTDEEPSVSSVDDPNKISDYGYDDVWIRYDNKVATDYITDESTIQEFITNHQKATYSGKSIGFVTTSTSSVVPILDDADNKVDLTFDFSSHSIIGSMQFKANNKLWKLYIGSAGDVVVTSSGYEGINFANASDSEVTILPTQTMLFYNRFYGSDAKEISSYFRLINTDDEEAYGLFVAKQDSLTTMTKLEQDSSDNIKWGYWAEEGIENANDTSKLFGAYIEASNDLTKTPEGKIQELINSKQSATYSTSLLGTVYQTKSSTTQKITNGSATFTIDFANEDVTGSMNFDAGSDKWRISFVRGSIDKSTAGFNVSEIKNSTDATVNATHHNISGNFYGNDAKNIAGTFTLSGSNGDIAAGAFKGAKQ